MLQYPIISRPIFLLEKNSLYLKKTTKADLTNSLLSFLNKKDVVTCDDGFPGHCPYGKSDAIVIDFMSVLRRLTSVDLTDVTTFGSLCDILVKTAVSYGTESDEVHLIMENYKHLGIKSSDWRRRASEKILVGCVQLFLISNHYLT